MAKTQSKVKRSTGKEQIIINDMKVVQLQRGNQTIQSWFQAVRSAEQQIMPDRRRLYNTFNDVTIDLHLQSMIDKRVRAVKTTPFEWSVPNNGHLPDPISENFKQEWFLHLLELIQSRIFWGTTLTEFELGDDGLINECELIPRQNVRPERGVIMLDGYTEEKGIRYKEGIYTNYVMQIGRKNDLGLLTRIAPYVIMKRQNLADFSRYNEMFGIPMRIYTYDPKQPGARDEVTKQADAHGSAAYIVIPKDMANVELAESNKSGSAMAFDKLHEILNREITVGILGQTLTTGGESGGSYELGKVHQDVEMEINLEDRMYAEYLINYPFRNNILIPHGYPMENVTGKFKVIDELPKEMKANMWVMLAKGGLPIAKEDFYTEFGIPMPEDRETLVIMADPTPPPPDPNNPPEPPTPPTPPKGGDTSGNKTKGTGKKGATSGKKP